ncbi:MAG: hypothetical protein QM736_02280 [Vicinamibacterales bacterium]
MTLPRSCLPALAILISPTGAGHRILVVGDVMLDRFIVGTSRASHLKRRYQWSSFQSEYIRLGGAANVAHNLADARAPTSSLVRNRRYRSTAAKQLTRSSIDRGIFAGDGLVDDRERVPLSKRSASSTDRNQQVARIDYEDDRRHSGDANGALARQSRSAGARQGCCRLRLSQGHDYRRGHVRHC